MDRLRRAEDLATTAQQFINSMLGELRLIEDNSVPTPGLMSLSSKVDRLNRSINGEQGIQRQMSRITRTTEGEIGH